MVEGSSHRPSLEAGGRQSSIQIDEAAIRSRCGECQTASYKKCPGAGPFPIYDLHVDRSSHHQHHPQNHEESSNIRSAVQGAATKATMPQG